MKKFPLVSIIMNCHNGEKYLRESIQSIINQKYKNWELIFWDNKSTDKSAQIFSKFKDKRLKYFYAKKKTTLYEARNFAINKSKGQFIAFLDVDDVWTKDKLFKQIPKFKDKKIGLVYSNFFKLFQRNKEKKIAHKNKLPEGIVTSDILKNYNVGIVTVVLRKKFLNKNKKIFDYNYDLLSDFDFVLHYSLKHKFSCINQPLAFYRIHDTQLQKINMVQQARQFCLWFEKKKISKIFKKYDLTSIYKKYRYFRILKNINGSKINLIKEIINNFTFRNFFKICVILFLPKKLVFDYIENV